MKEKLYTFLHLDSYENREKYIYIYIDYYYTRVMYRRTVYIYTLYNNQNYRYTTLSTYIGTTTLLKENREGISIVTIYSKRAMKRPSVYHIDEMAPARVPLG